LTLAWAAAPAQATTQTFTFTGAEQTLIVPAGVSTMHIVVIGGSGGEGADSAGGAAAQVTGDLAVTASQTLYVEVGGSGEEGGGATFNGGGEGHSETGSGGGASDVRTSPRSAGLSPDNRLIVAGGGGGGGGTGEQGAGGAGGAAGESGAPDEGGTNEGGAPGSAIAGGAGGGGCSGVSGTGDLGIGGAGGSGAGGGNSGGGGGGGYYGGGGGGCAYGGGGGGGGSSLVPPLGIQSLALVGEEPEVQITYTLPPPSIGIPSPANGAVFTQGQPVNADYGCTPPETATIEECSGPVANGAAIDTATLGTHSFTVNAKDSEGGEASKEVSYSVLAPPSISITSPANGATFTQGQAVTAIYSCTPAGGTGVKTCAGPVANGAALDTAALGSHSFEVKAEDLDGGKASQSVSYTVAPAPVACPLGGTAQSNELCPPGPPHSPALPSTALDSHPKSKIETTKKKVKVKFTFSSNTSGATFKCKLDKGSFAPCASPKTYKVKLGKHTFSVEAVSAGGTDPTPATFNFKVKKKS
jgi:hypothetical protein